MSSVPGLVIVGHHTWVSVMIGWQWSDGDERETNSSTVPQVKKMKDKE